jgi:hypothetical protein
MPEENGVVVWLRMEMAPDIGPSLMTVPVPCEDWTSSSWPSVIG